MKISEKLELDYNLKKNDDGSFMTKDTIMDKVAAELFIPIIEELYDNNIFTHWSGLEGDAHIRISLDGLSKENYHIAQENCRDNPNNWRLKKPPYKKNKDIAPNYSFEIFVNYDEGITDVFEVVSKMLAEIRKLSFQDVQIARVEYAKESKLPRVDLKGLYKRSETSIFDLETQEEKMVPAESFEELSEMFLEGENPQYFYDEETDTYFINTELMEKSKEYREYKDFPEKRKERAIRDISKRLNRKMSDEEKYKAIFDWCVNYFNYAYSGLYFAYAEAEWKKEKEEKNDKFYNAYRRKNSKAILSIDGRKGFLEEMQNNPNVPKEAIIHSKRIVEFLKNQSECMQKENGYDKNNNIDTAWTSQYGVCQSFASIYEFLCNYFNLSCKYIEGNINSNGYNVGHAWNVVMINGKLKHIDISSAIHCKDKTNQENKVEDFFLKTYDELIAIDNGKSREITENSEKVIKSFISNSVGFDVGD